MAVRNNLPSQHSPNRGSRGIMPLAGGVWRGSAPPERDSNTREVQECLFVTRSFRADACFLTGPWEPCCSGAVFLRAKAPRATALRTRKFSKACMPSMSGPGRTFLPPTPLAAPGTSWKWTCLFLNSTAAWQGLRKARPRAADAGSMLPEVSAPRASFCSLLAIFPLKIWSRPFASRCAVFWRAGLTLSLPKPSSILPRPVLRSSRCAGNVPCRSLFP